MIDIGRTDLHFKPRVIKRIQVKVERFLQLFLLLTYLTAGQPPRGTEHVTLRHSNAVAGHRTIYVHDEMVTEYDKTMAEYGNHKVVCRFLPERVGKLLVAFLSDALPFRRLLQTMGSHSLGVGHIGVQ